MKKFLSLIAVVFLLIQLTSLASDVDIRVVASRDTAINRAGSNLCFDLFVLNPNNDVNEIKFLVTCTINDSIIHALPTPGYLIKSDGTQDSTKWSKILDTVAINSARFRYYMAEDPSLYLGKSSNLRMIGTFYIKVGGGIPLRGEFKIKLEQISVTGVGNNSTIVNLSAPSAVSTTLDLGGNAPGDTNSLQLSTQLPTVDRPIHQARVRIAYKSPTISLDKITFDVWPQDLVPINIILDNPTGKVRKISNKIGDHYELSIESAPNLTFPTSAVATLLAEIVLNFDPSASGSRTIVMNNFKAWDASGQPISVTNSLSQTLQLGQVSPPTKDTLLLNATGSIDRLNQEVRIDFSYSGSTWDTISFDSNLPDGFKFRGFDQELTGLTSNVAGSRITISVNNGTVTTPPNAWFQIFTVIFSYDKNITGTRTVVLDNIIAKKGNVALVVPAQPILVSFDFGTKPPPDTTKLVVNYGLFLDNNWFYLDRPNGRGTISLLWYMDNIQETTGGINFDIDLPYYMNLQQVIPLKNNGSEDLGRDIGIQEINNNGAVKTYRVIYSSKNIVDDPLSPNPGSNNPAPIMKLIIGFTDLPAGTLTIPVNNIVASGLDGRVINQTKAMSIPIDFLNWIYLTMFMKGDVNTQFGDGQLTQADPKRLIQLMLTRVYTLYEAWASDMNKDIKVDVYDLTILQNLVGWTNVVDMGNPHNEITMTGRLVSFNFPDDSQIDFAVYDYLGRQIKHLSYGNPQGQVDLSDLNGGMYFIRVNKKVIKVLF